MIWVAWRQQRLQILVTVGLVVVFAAVLLYVRVGAQALLPDLAAVSEQYNQFLSYLPMIVLALPALFGVFTGAPLFAREIEQGTQVFGLTQSIGRARWWAIKLLVAGLPVTTAMFAFGLFASWALEPVSFVMSGRLSPPMFETQGVVIGAYTALAIAVGATLGLLLRNTLAAMVLTIAVYVLLMFTVANEVRPHYAAPQVTAEAGAARTTPMGAWRIGSAYRGTDGAELSPAFEGGCRGYPDEAACFEASGVAGRFTEWHPASLFWRFQFTETGLFLLLGAGVLGAGALFGRRRLV